MAELKYPHLFLPDKPNAQDYTSPLSGRSNLVFPERTDKMGHAVFVRNGLEKAWKKSNKDLSARKAVALPTRNGTYIEFESAPEFDLKTQSLELRPSGIRLLNVVKKQNQKGQNVTYATIYVPDGKEAILLKKVEQYKSEKTAGGNPKNQPLIDGIENLQNAVVESFWRDSISMLPKEESPEWCEVWLRFDNNSDAVVISFRELCKTLKLEIKEGHLSFPERAVFLIKAADKSLKELMLSSDYIAEFRRAKQTAEFWTNLNNTDQTEWIEAFKNRVSVDEEDEISLCILDTGANNGHQLLAPILSDDDCHTVKKSWGTADKNGHGTLMCGVAGYGEHIDLLLQDNKKIEVPYILESVKLIPAPGTHHNEELYGYHTKQALSRAEIEKPNHKRTVCLAITSEDGRDEGRPSSWSGSLDQISSGAEDGKYRLFIVAGGNVHSDEWKRYPDSNITKAIHDPGQAWNAVTVGAFTTKTDITDAGLAKMYKPIASDGQLSPFSTTSHVWESKWPNKPEVVFEGGNAGIDNTDFATELDDLSILTTNYQPQKAQLATIVATSAASAQAARMAARLQAQYPNAWPETIRALMIHSASWPTALKQQFSDPQRTEKQNFERLLRTCGFGVPNYQSALESAQNCLTLIAEQTIQPFGPKLSGKEYQNKDMHLYELPWPVEALKELPGETPVTINITLSYFVEPGPGEVGWRDKYRYRSHGLDFEFKKPTENKEEFVKRLNKAARGDNEEEVGGSSVPWAIGKQHGRTRGSIHRDWWNTTAAEAADSNIIGIFPRSGWWKERHHLEMGQKETRYSLIVSLVTTETKVDIYTPISVKVSSGIVIKT